MTYLHIRFSAAVIAAHRETRRWNKTWSKIAAAEPQRTDPMFMPCGTCASNSSRGLSGPDSPPRLFVVSASDPHLLEPVVWPGRHQAPGPHGSTETEHQGLCVGGPLCSKTDADAASAAEKFTATLDGSVCLPLLCNVRSRGEAALLARFFWIQLFALPLMVSLRFFFSFSSSRQVGLYA